MKIKLTFLCAAPGLGLVLAVCTNTEDNRDQQQQQNQQQAPNGQSSNSSRGARKK